MHERCIVVEEVALQAVVGVLSWVFGGGEALVWCSGLGGTGRYVWQ